VGGITFHEQLAAGQWCVEECTHASEEMKLIDPRWQEEGNSKETKARQANLS